MKKTSAVLLGIMACSLLFLLCSCMGKGEGKTDTDPEATPAQLVFTDFKRIMNDRPDISPAEAAEAIVAGDTLPFAGASMIIEPGYLNGFSKEITGFEEGAVFGPMIGSIPFIGYVFRLSSQADVAAFKKQLTDCADLRWNVCTQADEMLCENVGNTVFFIMSKADFED